MALISLDNVSEIYPKGTRPALDDINLDIERGDFVFLWVRPAPARPRS